MTAGNMTKYDFSRHDLYNKCPQSYKWKYIDYRKPKTPPNFYYALPGIVIQKLFENFYNDEWFLKRGGCREFMYEQAAIIYEKTLKWLTVDWQSRIAKKAKHEVYEDFLEMIGKNLDIVKEYKLLGKLAKSEFKLVSNLENNKYVVVTSKLDFLIRNQDGVQILDGKATSNKSNYLKNPDQLDFYAMNYKAKYGKYPDKIGFWFWRTAEICYVDLDESRIEALKTKIDENLYKIYKKKFDATPEYKSCLFCNYKDECFERKREIAEKQALKSPKVTDADLDLFI